jgi:hypothetical protein
VAGFLSQERLDSLLVYQEVEDFLKFLSMGVVPAAVAPRYSALTGS